MTEASSGILTEIRGRMAVITLNRPAALNAMTIEMVAQFNAAVAAAERDPAVLAIVVTGAGRAFCSGLDLSSVAEMSRTGDRRLAERGIAPEAPAQFANLRKIGKPVISAINGTAAGVGLVLALMSDIRIMAKDAVMTTSFAKLGLIAEHGTSWLLPRLVGTGRALDLLWTARKVGADEALEMGLVDRLAETDVVLEAERFVEQLGQSSPHAIAVMKTMVYDHLQLDFGAALRDADQWVNACISHPDVQEGILANKERRPPAFQPWAPAED